jgi:hypothetical protein
MRIAVGFALGLGLTYAVRSAAPSDAFSRPGFDPLGFLLTFLILRFIEWSAFSLIIRWADGSLALAGSGRDWLWRLGGVALSFFGDVVAVLVWEAFSE